MCLYLFEYHKTVNGKETKRECMSRRQNVCKRERERERESRRMYESEFAFRYLDERVRLCVEKERFCVRESLGTV